MLFNQIFLEFFNLSNGILIISLMTAKRDGIREENDQRLCSPYRPKGRGGDLRVGICDSR